MFHKIMEFKLKDADTYYNHGSTWIILTDKKQWVIELTKEGVLWYNYYFFQSIFTGLMGFEDTAKNQDYITKWVEDTIQNGVKKIKISPTFTEYGDWLDGDERLDEIIQNGVKETQFNSYENKSWVEGVIKGGVKETKQKDRARLILDIDGRGLILETNLVIRDGVKETNHVDVMKFFDNKMEDALENGVKSSRPRQYVGENIIDKIIDKGVIETHDDVYHHKGRIDGVIKNGVKETHREICEYKHTIDHIVQTGVKKIMSGNYTDPSTSLLHIKWEAQIEDVIDNGNKVCGTYVGGHRQEEKTETVIEYGKQI